MDREKLIARSAELVKTVEAIDGVLKSKDWQVLRSTFETLVEHLDKQLLSEAKVPKIDTDKIYFIQGQIATAKRYDLATYAESLKKELEGIKKNLQ